MRRLSCSHSRAPFADRRSEKRLLCSDLVQVRWTGEEGENREEIAIIEDVSSSGASLFTGVPLPEGAPLVLLTREMRFDGEVRYCREVGNGYAVGVRLLASYRQGPHEYTPEHLLDVSRLEFNEP